jgi:hypothetical protein
MDLQRDGADCLVRVFDNAPSEKRDEWGISIFIRALKFDAHVGYRLRRMHDFQAIVSMLRLTSEVFGFYAGREDSQSNGSTTIRPSPSASPGRRRSERSVQV